MTLLRILLLCSLGCVLGHSARAEHPTDEAKQVFERGVAQLEQQQKAICPNFPHIRATHKFQSAYPDTKSVVGFVRVTMHRSKDSEHLEEFTFAYREQQWVLTCYRVAATIDGAPPKVSITKPLTEEVAQKVQACFR